MTPEAWALVIAAILGSNGLFATILYIVRQRADVGKVEAERRRDETLKRYELKIKQLEGQQAKVASDERQEDKLTSLPSELAGLLKNSLDSNQDWRKELQNFRKHLEQIESRREDDYLANKTLYEQTHASQKILYEQTDASQKKLIEDVRAYFANAIANARTTFRADLQEVVQSASVTFKTDLEAAVIRNQTLNATRTIFETFRIGRSFPKQLDPRWKMCTYIGERAINAYKVPRYVDDNFIAYIQPRDVLWVIDEYSDIPEWAYVRMVNMPEADCYVELRGLKLEKCTPMVVKVNGGKVA